MLCSFCRRKQTYQKKKGVLQYIVACRYLPDPVCLWGNSLEGRQIWASLYSLTRWQRLMGPASYLCWVDSVIPSMLSAAPFSIILVTSAFTASWGMAAGSASACIWQDSSMSDVFTSVSWHLTQADAPKGNLELLLFLYMSKDCSSKACSQPKEQQNFGVLPYQSATFQS